MTTQQLVLGAIAVATPTIIPTVAVVISILRSDSAIEKLRTEVRSEIGGLRDNLNADIRILNKIAYEHHGRLTSLEKPE